MTASNAPAYIIEQATKVSRMLMRHLYATLTMLLIATNAAGGATDVIDDAHQRRAIVGRGCGVLRWCCAVFVARIHTF